MKSLLSNKFKTSALIAISMRSIMMKKRFDLIAYSYPSTLLDLTESTVKCVNVKK